MDLLDLSGVVDPGGFAELNARARSPPERRLTDEPRQWSAARPDRGVSKVPPKPLPERKRRRNRRYEHSDRRIERRREDDAVRRRCFDV
jgi:hypothetical protein